MKMTSHEIARTIIKSFPTDVFVMDKDCKDMKSLMEVAHGVDYDSGDGLFDFIVTEIGKETDRDEIMQLLFRALQDIQAVMKGFLDFKK